MAAKDLDEKQAYEAERTRASGYVVEASAHRRMGRWVRGDAQSWPSRTEREYDPRSR